MLFLGGVITQGKAQRMIAQDEKQGYFGYDFHRYGDRDSIRYETANKKDPIRNRTAVPDVYLNATVHVGEIDIRVDNLTAKVNLDARVLSLFKFNAGVTASVDKVQLNIKNVNAKVELEARLDKVVEMLGDVLNAVDANPLIATLGSGLGDTVGNMADSSGAGAGSGFCSAPGGSANSHHAAPGNSQEQAGGPSTTDEHFAALQFKLDNNILYSVNNFSKSKNRNRILAQNGSLIDSFLNNNGKVKREKVVGYYKRDMTFNGHNRTIYKDDDDDDNKRIIKEFELQYVYTPFPALEAVSNIYVTPEGKVTRTQVIAEAEGGGTASIVNNPDRNSNQDL